mmetsp:Transcript_10327/g.32773  ORF Transcript_10327/g.32773 Transcript_10327/m.32773 type:complete len:154 (-) Transcript_10327:201-662(-)
MWPSWHGLFGAAVAVAVAVAVATLRVMAYGNGRFPVTLSSHPSSSHRMFRDTAARESALMVLTPEPFTSKECCTCRRIMKLDSKTRVGVCSACLASSDPLRRAQAQMDRDRNAAFGILFRFLRGLARPLLCQLLKRRFEDEAERKWVLQELLR